MANSCAVIYLCNGSQAALEKKVNLHPQSVTNMFFLLVSKCQTGNTLILRILVQDCREDNLQEPHWDHTWWFSSPLWAVRFVPAFRDLSSRSKFVF